MQDETPLKICVLGAGSLGCAIGGTLARAGSQVSLVQRHQSQVDAINSRGLLLEESGAQGPLRQVVRVQAATDAAAIGPVDLVIVLVKSFDTQAAVERAMPLLGPHTAVLSLQNGLGHEELLTRLLGRERVLAGKTYVGGVLLRPGVVLASTRGKHTYIGELDGSVSARVRRIAAVFNEAGLATTASDNILGTIWDKLLVNVATGAVSGITRLPYGALYQVPEIEACAIAAVDEAMAVARAAGVCLSVSAARQAWLRAAEGLPAGFKASMLQSLEKGSPTEVDYINGAVVREGERLGVPTPVNRTLVACIKGIERALAVSATPHPEETPA